MLMNRIKKSIIVLNGVMLPLFMAGCVSKVQLKKTLVENPDLIFDVIEKNPEKFFEVSSKASMEARKGLMAKREAEEKTEREEEFKNPKMPEISSDRAIRGNPSAPITIVEYSDFQCPYCKRGFST